MKCLISICFLVAMVGQTFSTFIIQANYYINRSYIAKTLCENRNKPTMHCNGKCYMMRKLKQEEQQEKQAPLPKKEKMETQFLYEYPQTINYKPKTKNKLYEPHPEPLLHPFLLSVFHPPSA